MKTKLNEKGVTMIELLVALVICSIIIAAIYRLFVAQTRAYTVQDEVAEVQQNVRNAMELIVRDIRQAGFDDDPHTVGPVSVDIFPPRAIAPADNVVDVFYEHNGAIRQVTYFLNAQNQLLRNQVPADPGAIAGGDPILDNVTGFTVTYIIDGIGPDGKRDRRARSEVSAGGIGVANVVAVRVQLSARPASDNPEVINQVSPRALDSFVTMRNLLSDTTNINTFINNRTP
jgi:prepilin-type N-terminal cleavage/methylation domain-containing protein